MNDFITPFDDIFVEAQSYQDFLVEEFTSDDTASMIFEHGNKIAEIVSRTGKLRSDAKFYLMDAKRSEIIRELSKLTRDYGMSVTMQKELIDASMAKFTSLYEWVERLNRTATHQLDWCRTKISYIKEEKNASRGMNNQNNK
jgi:isopropylmalate/homocitrate/citramalate synthase